MKRDRGGGVRLLSEAGRVLRGPGSTVARFCSTVTRPLLPVSPLPRSLSPLDVCARGLVACAFKGSLLMVPRLGPQCELSSVANGDFSPTTSSSVVTSLTWSWVFSYWFVANVVFLLRSPLLTVQILKCPTTADIKCSLMPNSSIAERRLLFPHVWTPGSQ